MGKRLLLSTVAAFFSLVLNAQSATPIDGKRICYVQVFVESQGKFKHTAYIDYGFPTNKEIGTAEQMYDKLKDENGAPLKFRSKLGMINYMTLQGWTYLNNANNINQSSEWATFAKEISESDSKEMLPKYILKE
jgi:hypothetical protein